MLTRREDADLYVQRARDAMAAVDMLPVQLRRFVHEHGTVAVAEGRAFAGTDLSKLERFLEKRRDRRHAALLKIDVRLNG